MGSVSFIVLLIVSLFVDVAASYMSSDAPTVASLLFYLYLSFLLFFVYFQLS